MEIKGRCLKDFWKWYLLLEQRITYKTNSILGSEPAIRLRFLAMSFTERYGVFVDFFDSVGIDIEFSRMYDDFMVVINHKAYGKWLKTRHEIRTEAILKANEIYNEKN